MDIVLFGYQAFGGRKGRDHHFARILSEKHRVFFVDTPGSVLSRPSLEWHLSDASQNLVHIALPGGIPGRNLRPLHSFNQKRWLNGLSKQLAARDWGQKGKRVVLAMTPVWELAYDVLPAEVSVYDAHDRWDLMPENNSRLIDAMEDVHARRAGLVLAASEAIAARFGARKRRCEPLPNACEYDHFAQAAKGAPVAGMAALPEPRIAFIGGMDECFDTEAVAAAARAMPEASFVMIGPEAVPQQALSALPNVHRVGPRPYAELPAWLAGAKACLLPYRMSERTVARDPIKLYEYLASGRPVAACPHPRAKEFAPYVEVSDGTPQGFAQACMRAAGHPPDRLAAQQTVARQHTYSNRVARLEALLDPSAAT